MDVMIRQASEADTDAIYNMINGLSVYREAPLEAIPAIEEIRTFLFSPGSPAEAYICEIDGTVNGYAIISMSQASWSGRHRLSVEELYFTPDYRGRGAGKTLLQYIAQLAVSRQCSRIEWNVLEWDKPANEFYQSIDALPLNEWVRYRLDGPALERFASCTTL
ncbi:GNAT family N-acetyltransferase (plasmid) [Erwinia sp. E602]|uniref:GNAT family N-acetyltransferase n=1 Tax=Erwinia sp. E602 TaxID=2675378 RepID=UPI001BA4B909|nr:GNAT family N-acetyltransferase [Erwinia sp. E602]QUG73478.1 GNAT family N-acetyltransferase [Erwinia sp. E602]